MMDGPFAIDVRTMFVVMLMSAVLMATVLWFAYAGRFRDGLAQWTASLWTQALAWLLFAARGMVPDLFSVALANSLLIATAALQFAALSEFRRETITTRFVWVAPAVVFAVFMAIVDETRWQGPAGDLLYGAANLLIAISALRDSPGEALRARRLLTGCYVIAAVTLILKAGMVPDGSGAPTANMYHGFLYLGTYALIVAGSFAFLLLHKERSDEEASRLATTDPLTGVFNRRTFIELAEQELARSRRAATPLSVMMLDLDHFKRVNDTYGHLTGDEVLVSFTRLIRDCVRRGDLVVRYGGEEFCVLLPATTLQAATALAERIRARCAAQPLTARAFKVTVSIGLTAYSGDRAATLGDLLARADEALYRAKGEGRNQVIAAPLGTEEPATQHALPLEQVG
ncbi:MAG TPA: GGDEF domain-containing protein [Burkholderiales bacterium]|nr:GGDEF domain-containing protein [Burkholderiales bacterium]